MSYDPTTAFRGTAWHYARYRPAYPTDLFDHLVRTYHLAAGTRVVDMGTGTGQISIPLAKRGVPVLAIDPNSEMLSEGQGAAEREGVGGRVSFVEGRGEDLLEMVRGYFRLVTFGSSFHWTDRTRMLDLCDRLTDQNGGVVVISGGRVTITQPDETHPEWVDIVAEVVREFLGRRRRVGTGFYAHPEERHEQVLGRSKFSQVGVAAEGDDLAHGRRSHRISIFDTNRLAFAGPAALWMTSRSSGVRRNAKTTKSSWRSLGSRFALMPVFFASLLAMMRLASCLRASLSTGGG